MSRDVHLYDGQFSRPNIPMISNRIRDELFGWAMKTLPNCQGLMLVISDTSRPENFDPYTGSSADNILAGILHQAWTKQDCRQAIFSMLSEQLDDMYLTGRCPQGRVNRLAQIWYSIQ